MAPGAASERQMAPQVYQFGVFELNPRVGELRKHGLRLKLQDQPLRILTCLLERAGEAVSREELQTRLWSAGTHVDFENGINSAVRKLRDALGDTADNPRFIETLARRGYRFIAPVSTRQLPVTVPASGPQAVPPKTALPFRRLVQAAALALAAGAAALLLWRPTRQAASLELAPPVPLTSSRGVVCCPSFSPDGSRVAFSWNGPAQDNFDIYVKLIGPGEPVRLTRHAAADKFPAWSPDGRSIAFLRQVGDRHAAVMVMPPFPGPEREVATTEIGWPDLDYRDQGPALAWSADGRYLFTLVSADSSGTCGIVRVSLETGEQQRISSPPPGIAGDGSLAVSPDGRTLAFTRTIAGLVNSDIYTVSLSGGNLRRITFDGSRILGHAWSEDGRDLVFSSNRGGRVELWRIDASGAKKPVRLTGAGESDDSIRTILQLYPAVSRQGHRLVYTQPSVVGPDIRRTDLARNSQGAPLRLISSTRGERRPQYSPDGRKIAIHSNRSGRGEIWVYDADGSNPVRLTSFEGGFSGSPSWSPDGRSIAFDSSSLGNWDVYVVGAQGGSPVRLTTSPAMDEVPGWSSDGNWIYFASNRSGRFEVWKMRVDGSSQTQVTASGGFMALESADGRDLYYTKTDGPGALWSMPAAGGAERKVVESVRGRNFTLTKHRIWFMQEAGSEVALRSVEPGSAAPTTVSVLGQFLFHGLSVSPDERYALYSQADAVGSELMLVEGFR